MRAALALLLCTGCLSSPAALAPRPPPAPPPPDLTPPAFRLGGAVRPVRYAATLAVDPKAERFSGEISIDLHLAERTQVLWLHASHLDVDRAEVTAGGATVPATPHPAGEELLGFVLPAPIGPGEARLHAVYRGAISSTEWSGLFRQQAGGEWYAYSHFEPTDARAVFPCFDEPSFKVPWQLTLKVPRGLAAASNTQAEAESDEGGLHVVRFAATRPLPSYLVAFAVGPFERLDFGRWGQGHTPVGLLVTRGRAAEGQLAKAILGPGLERLEAYFAIPYAYGKLDVVGVPIFFGAMENPGLITMSADSLLARPEAVTPLRERDAAYILVHEMAHQWFGDLVTMAWWDDLWLNESFADWLADVVLGEWHPDWERDVYRISSARSGAMNADSLSSAPAIRQAVASPRDLGALGAGSYAITYLKGREVLSMTAGWLGPKPFQAGIRRHVASHADGNATAADLFGALAAEARAKVGPVLSTFLDQSGIPLVGMELRCSEGAAPSLHLWQGRYLRLGQARPDDRRWKVPLCVRYPAGAGTARACAVLEAAEQDVPLPGASGCPAWVIPNDGELGYYRVTLPPKLWKALLGGAAPVTRPERAGLLSDLFALVSSGDVLAADALDQVPAAVKSGDRHLISIAAQFVYRLGRTAVADPFRPKFVKMSREVFGPPARALGLRPRPGESENARLLRDVLIDAAARTGEDPALRKEARRLAAAWLANRAAVEPEAVEGVLMVAAGAGDAALYEQLSAAALATQDSRERSELFGAMGAFRAPALVERNLALLLTTRVDLREALFPLVFGALQDPGTRQLSYDFVKAHWDELAARLPHSEAEALLAAGSEFCDPEHRQDVQASFAPRAEKIPQGAAKLARTLELVDFCIAVRERQQASTAAYLQKF